MQYDGKPIINFQARSDVPGGPYMCVHLRRKDFLWGRPKQVPSIKGAAKQIKAHLGQLGFTTVFVATDAPLEGNLNCCNLMSGISEALLHTGNSLCFRV
jgi:hypothetical protein